MKARRAVKPYRPPLTDITNRPLTHQARTVGVYRLPLGVDPAALHLYFSQFGRVTDVALSCEPTTLWATVEFEDDKSARTAARHAIHQVGRHAVLVLRLHDRELPSRPFPGMEPLTSPLRQALLELLDAA